MKNDINKAYAEVYEIIQFLGEEYSKKLPNKLINFLRDNKDNDYIVIIDHESPLQEQGLLDDTINILALLKKDYWCKNDEEKEQLLNLLKQNEEEHIEKLKERYNTDNLFNNKKENSSIDTQNEIKSTAMIKSKEKNIIQKIFDKIKKLFIRK